MTLRRPTDTLAGCMWLPRFVDKARAFQAGTLDPSYRRAFCNSRGTDGQFFNHFTLQKDEILDAILRSNGDDRLVADWFANRPDSSPETILRWNELAPQLGRAGTSFHPVFLWAMKNIYPGCTDPRVDTVFAAIAWDEGFLDAK